MDSWGVAQVVAHVSNPPLPLAACSGDVSCYPLTGYGFMGGCPGGLDHVDTPFSLPQRGRNSFESQAGSKPFTGSAFVVVVRRPADDAMPIGRFRNNADCGSVLTGVLIIMLAHAVAAGSGLNAARPGKNRLTRSQRRRHGPINTPVRTLPGLLHRSAFLRMRLGVDQVLPVA